MRKKTLKLLAVIIQTSPERLWELQECNSTPPERFSHQPFYCSHWAKMWFWLLLPRDAPSTDFSHVGKCVLIPNHFNLSVSWRRQILIRVRFCQRCWAAWQSAGKAWKACTGRRKKAAAGVSNAMKCLPAIWKSQIKSFAKNLSISITWLCMPAKAEPSFACTDFFLFQSRDFPYGTGGSNFCYSKL